MKEQNISWAKIRENIISQRLESLGIEAIAVQALEDKIDGLEGEGCYLVEVEVDTKPIKYSPHYDADVCIVIVEADVDLSDYGDVSISSARYRLSTPEGLYDDVWVNISPSNIDRIETGCSDYHSSLIADARGWDATMAHLEAQFAV